jgi:hypothetical protein
MTDKNISNCRKVGGDYFRLINLRSSPYKLDHFLTFNFDDYWCFKVTGYQKLIEKCEDFLEFKYAAYIFFKKDIYNLENIQKWINWCIEIGGIQFLTKPVPPFNTDKVIIKK